MPGEYLLICFLTECSFIEHQGKRQRWPNQFIRELIWVTEEDFMWDAKLDISII